MEKVDEKYNEICEKLGFIPSEIPDDVPAQEDDSLENPFSILEVDEIVYLYKNGYLKIGNHQSK